MCRVGVGYVGLQLDFLKDSSAKTVIHTYFIVDSVITLHTLHTLHHIHLNGSRDGKIGGVGSV